MDNITNKWGIHPLELPSLNDSKRLEVWAMFLLELGQNGEYDLLMHYLTVAKNAGCLTKIRETAERVVRLRTSTGPKGGVKRARIKSARMKAVA